MYMFKCLFQNYFELLDCKSISNKTVQFLLSYEFFIHWKSELKLHGATFLNNFQTEHIHFACKEDRDCGYK